MAPLPGRRLHYRHSFSHLGRFLFSIKTQPSMGKRKRNSILQPCSSKTTFEPLSKTTFELQSKTDESVTVGDKEEHSDKEELKVTTDKGVQELDLCGIPLYNNVSNNKARGGVTFVLEKASLTLAYVGKKYQILSSDEHAHYMRKKNLDPYNYRPDIVFEALSEIMNSRLRMAGKLKAVYIRTDEGILIKVEPYAKIPRTLESFCTMMAQLRQKLYIKAKGSGKKILRVVANRISEHLPSTSHKIGLSFSSQKVVDFREYIGGISSEEEFVYVVGVMAHGKIECDYIEDVVSVSPFHLSSATCLRHICVAMDRKWGIL